MKYIILCIFITRIGSVIPGVGDSGGGSISRELFDNSSFEIEIPDIRFKNNFILNVAKVCREQTNLRSIKKHPIYETIYGRGRGRNAEKKVKIGEDFKILKNEKEDGSFIYPVEYKNVPIRKKSIRDVGEVDRFRRRRSKILYYKDFSIDFCTNIEELK
jgi:hypothetical protein